MSTAKRKLPRRWASRFIPGHNIHIPGTTHYLRSRTFQSYFNVMLRCHYASCSSWMDYGGRGITVCKSWVMSFESFLNDMGHRPIGMTIDRINPNKGYTKSNCRWSTTREQANNKRQKAA